MLLQLLLFFHVLAVCGLFSGAAIELACFARFRRAQTMGQAREALCHVTLVGPIMRASVIVLLAAGLWMVIGFGFGWQPWVVTALALTVFMTLTGATVNGMRVEALHGNCSQGEGPLAPAVVAARHDRLLNFTVALMPCALVSLLYLMTNKPELTGCIVTVVIAFAAASAASMVLSAKSEQAAAPAAAIPQ